MEQIMQKYGQRIAIAKEIREYMADGSEGKMEINNSVKLYFKNKRVYEIISEFNGNYRLFTIPEALDDNSVFKAIMQIDNITESVLLSEIYLAVQMANKNHLFL